MSADSTPAPASAAAVAAAPVAAGQRPDPLRAVLLSCSAQDTPRRL